jgi:CRP/FNR family transcriptional regulator/CRP/FNR family cyclic AMP-dependent transcriptional regulator
MARELAETLREAFVDLEPSHLKALVRVATMRKCRPREVIIRQNEPGDSLFVIAAGFFNVSVSGPDGGTRALGVMGPYEMFGELSLVDGAPRSATVVAHTRSELVCIQREAFLDRLAKSPALALAVMQLLARRIRRLTERCDDLVGLRVGGRLAKQLMLLAESHGLWTSTDRVRICIKLSQQELGDLVGASRESVNYHLRLWENEKVLAREGGHLVIVNAPLLRSFAS